MTGEPVEPRTLREEIMAGIPLNDGELGVLEQAALGRNAEQSGKALHYATETVKTHRKHAIAKLAARNIVHAVVIAVGMGYVNIEGVIDEHEARMASEGGGT